MADGHGGQRTPRSPSPVSNPGAGSSRTDGQPGAKMTGMAYGENDDFNEIQTSAKMNQSQSGASTPASSAVRAGEAKASPLFSATQRPGEAVTDGSRVGPGAGPMKLPSVSEENRTDAQMIGKYLPELLKMADEEGTAPGFTRFVRQLRNLQGE